MNALETRCAALARPDGTVALIGGEPGATEELVTAFVSRGYVLVASETAALEPEFVELDGREAHLLVVPLVDSDATQPELRRLTGGEAAYVVGSQVTALAEVRGGGLAALARLARRVAAYEVRYADPADGAREVARLWSTG